MYEKIYLQIFVLLNAHTPCFYLSQNLGTLSRWQRYNIARCMPREPSNFLPIHFVFWYTQMRLKKFYILHEHTDRPLSEPNQIKYLIQYYLFRVLSTTCHISYVHPICKYRIFFSLYFHSQS